MKVVVGSDGGCADFVARDLEADGQSAGVELRRQPLGPLGQRHAVELALIDQAAGNGLLGAGEAIEILVEERQPAPRIRPSA